LKNKINRLANYIAWKLVMTSLALYAVDKIKDKFMKWLGRGTYGTKKTITKTIVGSFISSAIPVIGPAIASLVTGGTKETLITNVPFYTMAESS
jgi:hypothetical protein